ncbi:MAG: ATP-binding protein [Solirubrobacterales bacterium]
MKALHPRRWPVRWRIAGVSAGLTLLILLVFALVVGRLVTDKLHNDFNDDLQQTANEIGLTGGAMQTVAKVASTPGGVIRFVDASGQVAYYNSRPVQTPGAPPLGAPDVDSVTTVGPYKVASAQVSNFSGSVSEPQLFVQYARPHSSVDSTVSRLWLLLGIGVLGGTALAALAGMAVAQRAMRPIAQLTAAARQVATTRDPSQRIPMPETDDEVAELARTLDQMLRELDAARDETQQMIQAQRDFVADASHELRTPLTSILANLELLEARLAETDADSEEAEIVSGALGSSRRMRRLVADLLLLARADAGRAGPRRPCDLREIADGALAEVRVVAPDHRLTIHDGEEVWVDGDPNELHRLVLNLLENGVRHTPPGTEVKVSISNRDASAVLEVSDNGPGLPDGVGDQIFGRFVRGNGPADLVSDSGTGLGLAIVKAVATSHGGTVVAGRSEAGGAKFTVTLPASTESLASVYTPG